MTNILFICHGNICRSTMAESLFAHLVREKGLANAVSIDSAGTSREELGHEPHPGTRQALARHGVPLVPHRARQVCPADGDRFDLLIAMDEYNLPRLRTLSGHPEKIHLLLDWTDRPGNIADPWYTGDFEATYQDVLAGCEGLLTELLEKEGLAQ